MPIVVASKSKSQGYVKIPSLGTSVIVFKAGKESDDYMVEGYIDVRELNTGDRIKVCETIAVDGVVDSVFLCVELSDKQAEPVLRFHTKTLLANMIYKVIIEQLYGYLIGIYYGFIKQVLGTA